MTEAAIEKENKEIAKQYKELLRISYQTLTDEDKKLIRSAFDVAVDAHKDQRRKSGEAYIFHPIAVAKIVASEIGLDAVSIASALLHDVVEDTVYTLADIERMFGETVARIVDGLTKIAHLKKDKDISQQAENFRKMLLTLHDDVRVIIIKIADRYHNMLTMDSMPEHKQVKIASETLYIYAPLAHRIGLYNIKTHLEDLSLKYTELEVYHDIYAKIEDTEEESLAYIEDFSNVIRTSLDKEGLNYFIKGRMKSIFSIRRKMKAQNVSFDEVYDKFAIRIIYKSDKKNEKFLAWKIYSIVTDHFTPNPIRLRDWITSPKSTGYEALHITVMGPKGKWVEVQIRSERMHEIAEKGYANIRLTVNDDGGHSSQPPEHTAVGVLSQAIVKLENNQLPTDFQFINKTFEKMGYYTDFPTRMAMANLWLLSPLIEGAMLSKPSSAASIRTTTAATMVEGSSKSNILPTQAVGVINYRLMPGMTIDDLVAHVNGTIDDPRVGVEAYMANEASNVSTMDSMGYRLIESTIRTMQNETLVAPYLVQGGTDAKHFTALSDSIYRFMMVELNPETLKQFHGVNEQIPITDYISAIQFYGELIKQSAQGSVNNQ